MTPIKNYLLIIAVGIVFVVSIPILPAKTEHSCYQFDGWPQKQCMIVTLMKVGLEKLVVQGTDLVFWQAPLKFLADFNKYFLEPCTFFYGEVLDWIGIKLDEEFLGIQRKCSVIIALNRSIYDCLNKHESGLYNSTDFAKLPDQLVGSFNSFKKNHGVSYFHHFIVSGLDYLCPSNEGDPLDLSIEPENATEKNTEL